MGKIMLSQGLALGLSLLLLLTLSGSPDNADPVSWIVNLTINRWPVSAGWFVSAGWSISAGWFVSAQAHVTDAPTISNIPDQTVYQNRTTGPISFTVDDADTPVETLTLTAQTSNPTLVPISHITLGGGGMTRTVALTPTANTYGTVVISIGVSDGMSTTYGAFTVTVLELERIYLPVAWSDYLPTPDLIVTQITAVDNNVYITIKNQGDMPVDRAFWVDAYINPSPVPTRANQTWDKVSSHGMAWGLRGEALPIAIGGIRTLSIGDAYYEKDYSLTTTLTSGMTIYAQVDSLGSDYGAVLEQHERSGAPYNNIMGITLTNACNLVPSWPADSPTRPGATSAILDDKNLVSTLPPRRRR